MDLPLDRETFYAKLRAAGYRVMGCGKMDLSKSAYNWGVTGTHPLPDGRTRTEAWGFTDAVDNSWKIDGYLEAEKGNYCPYTHFLKDHNLLQKQLADFEKRIGPSHRCHTEPTPLPDFAYADNFEGEQGLSLLQQAPPTNRGFCRSISVVRMRGETDHTLIISSSDHGDMPGDRGRWGKTLPYQPSMDVPLVIGCPAFTLPKGKEPLA